jgi:hypothetical protein
MREARLRLVNAAIQRAGSRATAGLAFVLAVAACGSQPVDAQRAAARDRLVSARVTRAPDVDGRVDDLWSAGAPLNLVVRRVLPPRVGASADVELRSLHTDTHVYVLARWRDETRDDASHKSWVWNAASAAYEEGPDREDMFSLAFEHTGGFDADMLSGQTGVWDVWQWKATRTDPQGFAMDRTHRYSLEKPEGKAKSHTAKNGTTIWIARPEDAGDTVERKQPAPKERRVDRVPQYLAGTPTASAADVRARGLWSDGWWTLECERRLDTGHADDTAFDTTRTFLMAVGAHDRTGDMDKASELIELSFE